MNFRKFINNYIKHNSLIIDIENLLLFIIFLVIYKLIIENILFYLVIILVNISCFCLQ